MSLPLGVSTKLADCWGVGKGEAKNNRYNSVAVFIEIGTVGNSRKGDARRKLEQQLEQLANGKPQQQQS